MIRLQPADTARPAAADLLRRLTAREREVLLRTAQGFSSNEIAGTLHISSKTVETYRARVMEKFGLTHRSGLVRIALEAGLLAPS